MCRNLCSAIAFVAGCIVVFVAVQPGSGRAATVYANDFQGVVGSEWSSTQTETPPADPGRWFLGRFANDAVSLSLSGLPSHTNISLDFDLFIMSSWDGDGPEPGTPDLWRLSVTGGPVLLYTTFSNFPNRTQDYPGPYNGLPDATNPPKTGAAEVDTLGYPGFLDFVGGDSVYHLSFTFPHSADSLTLAFQGGPGLTSVPDESWGLDNVVVDAQGTVPEPSSGVLVLLGLVLCTNARRVIGRGRPTRGHDV